eukprot:jgi/Hompol1/530/HPOL_002529-RA
MLKLTRDLLAQLVESAGSSRLAIDLGAATYPAPNPNPNPTPTPTPTAATATAHTHTPTVGTATSLNAAPALFIDGQRLELVSKQEDSLTHCFQLPQMPDSPHSSDTFRFVGRITHRLQAQPGSMLTSSRIKGLAEADRQAKSDRSVVVLATPLSKSQLAGSSKAKGVSKKQVPVSRVSTAVSVPSTNPKKFPFHDDPELRRKLIHFLAPSPQRIDVISKKLKIPEPILAQVLLKVYFDTALARALSP